MRSSSLRLAAYALAATLALGELVVFALALSPQVHPDYRAYYLDRSTTCLPRSPSGANTPGETITMRPGVVGVRQVRGCGWQGPAGNGLHSIGTRSQIHLAVPAGQPLELELAVAAELRAAAPIQRIRLSIDGVEAGSYLLTSAADVDVTVPVPAAAAADGRLTLQFDFPDAFEAHPLAPDTDLRAIRLLAVTVRPAEGAPAPAVPLPALPAEPGPAASAVPAPAPVARGARSI
jgi:hypothetical protein